MKRGAFGIFLASLALAAVRAMHPDSPGTEYLRLHDETNFYLPAIRQIYARWPTLDLLADSRSATAPGYAYLMATAAKIVGIQPARLRFIQMLLSAAVPAILYLWLRRRWTAAAACLILAPFLFSSFFIKASAYLVTDNAALLCAATVLLILVDGKWSAGRCSLLVAGEAAAVLFRQSSLWLAVPAAVLFGIRLVERRSAADRGADAAGPGAMAAIAGAAILPTLIVGRMYAAWHGLVPPSFQTIHQAGFGLAPLAYTLSLIALFWWPYLIFLIGFRACAAWIATRGCLAAAAGALALAAVPKTGYDVGAGRWGGYLWAAVERLPVVEGRSVLFLVLAPLGGAAVWLAFRELAEGGRARAALIGTALAAWAASSSMNRVVFHRYYEPYVLLFAIMILGMAGPRRPASLRNGLPLTLFAAFQLAVTITTLYFSQLADWRR